MKYTKTIMIIACVIALFITVGCACESLKSEGIYKGCFIDESERHLDGAETRSEEMTPLMCNEFCKEEGYKYHGVEFGTECYCGNSYGKYEQQPEESCQDECSGNNNKICGDHWKINIYEVE